MIDFQITEAIALKVLREDSDLRKQRERSEWKTDLSGLKEKVKTQ